MKLHVAGMMLPSIEAAIIAGAPSMRPPALQAITSAGASPMWSPRKSAEVRTRSCWAFSSAVSLTIEPTYTPSRLW